MEADRERPSPVGVVEELGTDSDASPFERATEVTLDRAGTPLLNERRDARDRLAEMIEFRGVIVDRHEQSRDEAVDEVATDDRPRCDAANLAINQRPVPLAGKDFVPLLLAEQPCNATARSRVRLVEVRLIVFRSCPRDQRGVFCRYEVAICVMHRGARAERCRHSDICLRTEDTKRQPFTPTLRYVFEPLWFKDGPQLSPLDPAHGGRSVGELPEAIEVVLHMVVASFLYVFRARSAAEGAEDILVDDEEHGGLLPVEVRNELPLVAQSSVERQSSGFPLTAYSEFLRRPDIIWNRPGRNALLAETTDERAIDWALYEDDE